jgi:hypothetical protein
MPLISIHHSDPAVDGRQSQRAMMIRRGVQIGLSQSQIMLVPEISLKGGRRADLVGIDPKGQIIIVEIKSSIADFRVDHKWHEYKEFCDQFYFATLPDVPSEIFPDEEGLIIADNHGCEIMRDAQKETLAAASRKALLVRISRQAISRLQVMTDHYGQDLGSGS